MDLTVASCSVFSAACEGELREAELCLESMMVHVPTYHDIAALRAVCFARVSGSEAELRIV